MNAMNIDAHQLKRGDLIVVPRGKGKHRGQAEDSGMLEVTSTLHWGDYNLTGVWGMDFKSLHPANVNLSDTQRLEIIR